MMRSDTDGFDDGFDPFAEEQPDEHKPVWVADAFAALVRAWVPGDPPNPGPKQVKCGQCHKDFMTQAVWFSRKWRFAGICLHCADDNTLPPGFVSECQRPPVKQMSCPRCGISRGVEGTLHSNLWQYELTCSHCGFHTTIMRRLRRNCVNCGEEFVVHEKRPIKVCRTCDKKTSAEGQY